MEIPYAEPKFVPKNLSWDLRLQKVYRSFKKTIPAWYLLSVVLAIYVYIKDAASPFVNTSTGDDSIVFQDTYQRSADDGHGLPYLKKSMALEEFPFEAGTCVLPIAPYKQVRGKLDFRATAAVYLEAIRTHVEKITSGEVAGSQPPVLNFHWKDFVDLHILDPLLEEKPNCFRIGALGSTTRIPWQKCLDEPQNLGFVFINPSLEPETEFRLSIRGKSYLYTAAPLPNKMVFLAGELALVGRIGKKLALDQGLMIDEYVRRKIARNQELTQDLVVKSPIDAKDEIDGIAKALNRGLINFGAKKTAKRFVDMKTLDLPTTKMSDKLDKTKLASHAQENDDRHFRDVVIKSKDGKWASTELYDWRFFNKKLNNLNKRKALHGVVENYLQLCSNLGITTWLSPDSLTSWTYNGLMGPWEDTVRFELPAEDLNRLATGFNYSLVIGDPKNTTGGYLMDISPWYLERAVQHTVEASPDAADGRFVDIRTGIYIEIAGVAQVPDVPEEILEKYQDKDLDSYVFTGFGNHWYLPDLLPLNKTLYEGKQALVPKTLPSDLAPPPSKYVYREHLRLFVDEAKCSYVPEEEKDKFDLTYIGCCHDNLIWKEYNSTKNATLQFLNVNGYPINVKDEVSIIFD